MEGEGEMDVSDSEEEPQRKKSRNPSDGNEDVERLQALKEENDSLRCQLEAYKNEVCRSPTLSLWNVCRTFHLSMLHLSMLVIKHLRPFSRHVIACL